VRLLTSTLGIRIIVSLFVNILMDLKVIGWGFDWIDLAQDMDNWRARVKTVMKFRVQ
jgi:hypothetical protein